MTRSATHILAELLGVPYAEKRELLTEFLEALAPPQNEALRQSWARGQCAMVGTVADALPNDAEKDAIVEEVFARATAAPTKRIDAAALYGELPEKEQETIREIARRAAARATRKVDSVPDANGAPSNRPLFAKITELAASVPDEAWDKLEPSAAGGDAVPGETRPTPKPGDRVGPDDVGVGDVVREEYDHLDTHTDLTLGNLEPDGSWRCSMKDGSTGVIRADSWALYRYTLVSRAEPAPPQPPPVQLQVGHRYRARDGSAWDCKEEEASAPYPFRCVNVDGLESDWFVARGWRWDDGESNYDLIEDLGPTPNAKPFDIDAVLAPIERALEHIAGLSSDTRASEIATTAYGVAGNVLRQAVAKAREGAK